VQRDELRVRPTKSAKAEPRPLRDAQSVDGEAATQDSSTRSMLTAASDGLMRAIATWRNPGNA
jgi:hypothetical protein